MKKTIITLLIISLLMVLMTGCGKASQGEPDDRYDGLLEEDETTEEPADLTDLVYFSELKYDPETGSIHYVIVNDSSETVTVGGDIRLRKKQIDGLWADVMPLTWNDGEGIDRVVTALKQIQPSGRFEDDFDAVNTFGELSEGEYGIFIDISTSEASETISGGFTVAPMM